jgi:2-oxoglutarate/2-oxoacid ferredoxin oxidoreductase subunit alpha
MAIPDNDECFKVVQEAVKIAVKYMTPVILLSDSYLAHNSGVFKIPTIDEIEKIKISGLPDKELFSPYLRDKETLARPWAIP